MTRPQVKLFWHYMQRRLFRDLERQATAIWGYDPKRANAQAHKKESAERWQKDPLWGFPQDIVYFGRQEIASKVAVSRRFWKSMDPEKRWDDIRAKACFGRLGPAARRCSMNDRLWGIWRESKAKGVSLTLDTIKKMIMIDIKRSKLYPPGWIDDRANPPQWHLDELRNKGLLDGILRKIDEATKT